LSYSVRRKQVANGLQAFKFLATGFAAGNMGFDHGDVCGVELAVDKAA
jgi:hypothetical protein